MGTRLTIRCPPDYLLRRDYCSYGYFLLAPNHWDVQSQSVWRVLHLPDGPVRAAIAQEPASRGSPINARFDHALSSASKREARRQIARMLRLNESTETIREFHALDPRFRRSGRGRVSRSPTLFEDVIKTVTSCNVQWPSTITMNTRLCEVLGTRADASTNATPPFDRWLAAGGFSHAFPNPARVARSRASTLRARCRTGYRDQRIVELARLFSPRGRRPPELDPDWFEDPASPDDEVHAKLLSLPGIGPYAAANIMQLLGRYDRLPLDTESVRHGRTVLGFTGSDAQVMKQVAEHFEPFGRHRFRSYWLELWTFYESRRGPAWTWQRQTTGATFTASQL